MSIVYMSLCLALTNTAETPTMNNGRLEPKSLWTKDEGNI